MRSQLTLFSLISVLAGLMSSQATADVLFLAHYDTSQNADYAVGSATERGRGNGSISSDGAAVFGQTAVVSDKLLSYNLAGNLNATSGTVMLWAKVDAYGQSGGTGQSAWFSVGTTNVYSSPATTDIYLRGNAWNSATLTISDGTNTYNLTYTTTPNQATWNNYSFTWNVNTANSTINLALYVNGVQVAAQSNVAWNGFNFTNTGNNDTDNVIYVGGAKSYNAPGAYGRIDEVVITNDAKTADQIKALYDLQTGSNARALTADDLKTAVIPEPASLGLLASFGLGAFLIRATKK